ncbi:unnamed protein product [Diplocarpon coronariae]
MEMQVEERRELGRAERERSRTSWRGREGREENSDDDAPSADEARATRRSWESQGLGDSVSWLDLAASKGRGAARFDYGSGIIAGLYMCTALFKTWTENLTVMHAQNIRGARAHSVLARAWEWIPTGGRRRGCGWSAGAGGGDMSSPIRPKATGGVAAGCREGRCRWRWRWRWGGLESRGQGKGEGKRPASNGDKCASKASTFQDPPPLNLRPFDLRPATLDSQLSPPPSPLDRAVAITPGSTCRPPDLPTSHPYPPRKSLERGESPSSTGQSGTRRYSTQLSVHGAVHTQHRRAAWAWAGTGGASLGTAAVRFDGSARVFITTLRPDIQAGQDRQARQRRGMQGNAGQERLTGHARRKTAGHGTATHRESFTSGTGELPTIHEAWNTVQSYGDDQRTTRSWQYSKPHHLGWDFHYPRATHPLQPSPATHRTPSCHRMTVPTSGVGRFQLPSRPLSSDPKAAAAVCLACPPVTLHGIPCGMPLYLVVSPAGAPLPPFWRLRLSGEGESVQRTISALSLEMLCLWSPEMLGLQRWPQVSLGLSTCLATDPPCPAIPLPLLAASRAPGHMNTCPTSLPALPEPRPRDRISALLYGTARSDACPAHWLRTSLRYVQCSVQEAPQHSPELCTFGTVPQPADGMPEARHASLGLASGPRRHSMVWWRSVSGAAYAASQVAEERQGRRRFAAQRERPLCGDVLTGRVLPGAASDAWAALISMMASHPKQCHQTTAPPIPDLSPVPRVQPKQCHHRQPRHRSPPPLRYHGVCTLRWTPSQVPGGPCVVLSCRFCVLWPLGQESHVERPWERQALRIGLGRKMGGPGVRSGARTCDLAGRPLPLAGVESQSMSLPRRGERGILSGEDPCHATASPLGAIACGSVALDTGVRGAPLVGSSGLVFSVLLASRRCSTSNQQPATSTSTNTRRSRICSARDGPLRVAKPISSRVVSSRLVREASSQCARGRSSTCASG